jgi:hypothetical protein
VPDAYPLVTFNSLILHTTNEGDCVKFKALYDFLWWSQSDHQANLAATRNSVVVASNSDRLKRRLVRQLSKVRCNGLPASSVYACIMDDMVCSNHGVCVNSRCQCDDGFSGSYCQSNSTSSDDTGTVLALSLGIALPIVGILLLIAACVIGCLCCWARKKGGGRNDWEISTDELEMGDPLGAGGYGEVYRARWRGTEVAVKMIPPAAFGKDTARSFIEEVRVMTALRHPNVVLFMAACTKPPKMCIVMEYMALGSLYEVTNLLQALDCVVCAVGCDMFAYIHLAARSCSTTSSSPSCRSRSRPRWRTRRPRACTSCIRRASCTAISSRSTCCSTTSGTSRSRTLASLASARR